MRGNNGGEEKVLDPRIWADVFLPLGSGSFLGTRGGGSRAIHGIGGLNGGRSGVSNTFRNRIEPVGHPREGWTDLYSDYLNLPKNPINGLADCQRGSTFLPVKTFKYNIGLLCRQSFHRLCLLFLKNRVQGAVGSRTRRKLELKGDFADK